MNINMKKVRSIFQIFTMVTSCVLVAVALFTTVFQHSESMNPMVLWQIPAVSMLCALGCLIYPEDLIVTKKAMGIRIFLHYLYINAVVLASGRLFDWYDVKNVKSVLYMMVTIAVIFALVSAISWSREAREAKRMNERLQQYQQEKAGE